MIAAPCCEVQDSSFEIVPNSTTYPDAAEITLHNAQFTTMTNDWHETRWKCSLSTKVTSPIDTKQKSNIRVQFYRL